MIPNRNVRKACLRHTSKTHEAPANIRSSHLSRLSRLGNPLSRGKEKPNVQTPGRHEMRPAFAGELFKVLQIRVFHVSSHLQNHKSPANIEMSHLSRLSRLKSPSRRKPHDKTRAMVLWSRGPVVPQSCHPALIRSFPALSVIFDFFGSDFL